LIRISTKLSTGYSTHLDRFKRWVTGWLPFRQ
jgi:hypothetical protein